LSRPRIGIGTRHGLPLDQVGLGLAFFMFVDFSDANRGLLAVCVLLIAQPVGC
jgi:hypothetical protein